MSRASGFASVFALGVVLMLAASPASAGKCLNVCTCATSCDQTCIDGPCGLQGCEIFTCGEWGICIGSSGCTGVRTTCTSTINGGSSGDTLTGGSASECINGNAGDDTLTGNAGDDTIHGGDGNDSMYGNSGNDCLYGDAGSDNVNGDSGSDLCDAETELTCER